MVEENDADKSKRRELWGFFFLTVIFAPALAVAIVGGYGFLVWIGFVHRADRLDALLAALSGRAGEIVVFPLWPRQGQAAKRILVRARKQVATPLRLSPGLVLHEADGRFTAAANAVLRDGAGGLEL